MYKDALNACWTKLKKLLINSTGRRFVVEFKRPYVLIPRIAMPSLT